jgi:hypothetical protein
MKLGKRPFTFVLLAAALGVGGWLVTNSRAATETPKYEKVRTDGKIEIRDYPELMVATAPMKSDMDNSFMTLFRFITGANEGKQKIEMTSPVLIASEKDARTMSFIVPKATVEQGIPKPTGDLVKVHKIEAARFVALRFSGKRSSQTETKAVEKLRTWMTAEKLAAKGEPVFAYYDPPWTPLFMRRNEVMLRIEKPAPKK